MRWYGRWWLVATGLLVLLVVGCTEDPTRTSGHPKSNAPEIQDVQASDTVAAVPVPAGSRRTAFSISMARGVNYSDVAFEALDPRRYAQTITLEVTPPNASLRLDMRTSDGIALLLLKGRMDSKSPMCHQRRGSVRCRTRFPLLEAREPGEWQAQVKRLGGTSFPITVQMEVKWWR